MIGVKSRILTSAASIVLAITASFFPIWVISMKAPFLQYPLTIGIYPFQGIVGDLKNLNIVNHYVGLGEIDPARIPEIAYTPILYGAYILLMIVLTILNGRNDKLFYTLFGIYIILLAIFPIYAYLWMYGYTHSVNPNAPIRLEPFDPPFFGVYKLANFHITSYLGPAFFLPLAASIIQLWTNRHSKKKEL